MILISINIIAVLVFISLDPYLYSHPVTNTLQLYNYRSEESYQQASRYPLNSLDNFSERIQAIYTNFFSSRSQPTYHSFIILESILPFYRKISSIIIGFGTFVFIVEIVNVLFMIFRKAILIAKPISIKSIDRTVHPKVTFFIIFLSVQIIMGMYLKLNWDRYYIQLTIFIVYFQMAGIFTLGKLIRTVVKNIVLKKSILSF